jgi:hypothetical protein
VRECHHLQGQLRVRRRLRGPGRSVTWPPAAAGPRKPQGATCDPANAGSDCASGSLRGTGSAATPPARACAPPARWPRPASPAAGAPLCGPPPTRTTNAPPRPPALAARRHLRRRRRLPSARRRHPVRIRLLRHQQRSGTRGAAVHLRPAGQAGVTPPTPACSRPAASSPAAAPAPAPPARPPAPPRSLAPPAAGSRSSRTGPSTRFSAPGIHGACRDDFIAFCGVAH